MRELDAALDENVALFGRQSLLEGGECLEVPILELDLAVRVRLVGSQAAQGLASGVDSEGRLDSGADAVPTFF